MKNLLLMTLLGLSMAVGTAFAADVAPQKAEPKAAKVTSKTKSMAELGRYHTIHKTSQKLDCEDCHGGGEQDILYLRTGEPQGSDGPVDREGCLTCHQAPKKPTYYAAPK
jgi:hypothetical protein